jgi:glutathione S-transferase
MNLYHILNDDDCAEVRRFIVQRNLMEQINFRNIDRSESATKDLMALQGSAQVPFLEKGDLRLSGKVAILTYLQSFSS